MHGNIFDTMQKYPKDEDRLTAALALVWQHTNPQFRATLLRRFGIRLNKKYLVDNKIDFNLQSMPSPRNKFDAILHIYKDKNKEIPLRDIVIESKNRAGLGKKQLQRYSRYIKPGEYDNLIFIIPDASSKKFCDDINLAKEKLGRNFKHVTWEEIYRSCKPFRVINSKDQFLLHQFCDFLEYNGLVPWEGFDFKLLKEYRKLEDNHDEELERRYKQDLKHFFYELKNKLEEVYEITDCSVIDYGMKCEFEVNWRLDLYSTVYVDVYPDAEICVGIVYNQGQQNEAYASIISKTNKFFEKLHEKDFFVFLSWVDPDNRIESIEQLKQEFKHNEIIYIESENKKIGAGNQPIDYVIDRISALKKILQYHKIYPFG